MKKSHLQLLGVSTLMFLVLSACAPNTPPSETQQTSETQQPVVIYSQEVSSVQNGERRWPTLRVLAKKGDNPPEVLIEEIGKVGEYPNTFTLSPDNKTLYINLEKRLVAFDMESRAMKDFFKPKKAVNNFIFTDDGEKLLIWDQIYGGTDYEYFLHEYDLASGEAKELAQGVADGKYLFISKKLPDGTPLLYQAMGEAAKPWIMDRENSYALKEIPGLTMGSPYGVISTMGTMIGKYEGSSTVDVCNDFAGSGPASYTLVETLTGLGRGSFGEAGKVIEAVTFAPDDSEVIFVAYDPWKKQEDCAKDPVRHYYFYEIDGEAREISREEFDAIRRKWNPSRAGFEYIFTTKELKFNGETFFVLPTGSEMIVAFVD